ncbi:lysophospholipid acyltransferase family protein [Candidatus Pelagibacter sp.]|nr:lysophospholipid acyltransferase family protein [Candidatus Pelagibacter sp.]
MKHTKYFLQFCFVIIFFSIFKFLGPKISSNLGGKLFEIIGPFFRSKNIIKKNLQIAINDIRPQEISKISKLMWNNYGRVFAEYMFMKDFRLNKLNLNIQVEGQDILENLKKNNQSAVFISGHFANFELMAMHIEKSGLDLCAIYRPLNNIFINKIMEKIRTKYICKNQIKKGIGGIKNLISFTKKNYSTALMIDQRVSEGTLSKFFGKEAYTTTIPAQLAKKFNMPIIPVHIERLYDLKFKIKINKPIYFERDSSIQFITDELNIVLQEMVKFKPHQWIWSHNRWK